MAKWHPDDFKYGMFHITCNSARIISVPLGGIGCNACGRPLILIDEDEILRPTFRQKQLQKAKAYIAELIELNKKYDMCIAASDEMSWGIKPRNPYMEKLLIEADYDERLFDKKNESA